MNHPVSEMRSLLWKDWRTIKPLVIMACVGIGVLNLVTAVAQWTYSTSMDLEGFAVIWVLIPNLVTIGAPAMLVGGEEDSGTLSWLRTLPVRWESVVHSKLLVGAGATLVTWLFASAFMLLFAAVLPWPGGLDIWASILATANFVFFTALLLLVGFVCAYAFRSPIAGLIALLPAIILVYWSAAMFAAFVYQDLLRFVIDSKAHVTGQTSLIVRNTAIVVLAVLLLVAVWFLQRWLGRRRLTKPIDARRSIADTLEDNIQQPYRPPMLESQPRPSQLRALYWQQYRQIAWPLMSLLALGLVGAVLTRFAFQPTDGGTGVMLAQVFGPMSLCISAIGLGSLVFYGDNINSRRMFFSDRGISANRVWWTRMLLPLLGSILLTAAAYVLLPDNREGSAMKMGVPLLFVFGQMVSMWMSRPVLSLFTGPVYASFFGSLFSGFFSFYYGYGWTSLLVIPVLLIATWWTCRQWLTGKADRVFHGWMIGFSIAAAMLPIVCVLGHRVATTPALNETWRAKAMAASEQDSHKVNTHANWSRSLTRSIQRWGTTSNTFNLEQHYNSRQALQDALETEIDSEEMSASPDLHTVTNDDIAMILDQNNTPWGLTTGEQASLRYLAVKLVLMRVHLARRTTAESEKSLFNLTSLHDLAGLPEAAIVRLLAARASTFGDQQAVAELVAMIPSAELRQRSRQRALLFDWRQYQAQASINSAGHVIPRRFANIQPADPGLFGIEDRRSRRYIDELVQLLWEQLVSGLPIEDSVAIARRDALANKAVSSRKRARFPVAVFSQWTQDYEDQIADLRQQYPAEPSSDDPLSD